MKKVVFLSFLIAFIFCFFSLGVNAETTTFENGSHVMDDLLHDSSFKIEDFPEDINNNSLSVINIAESSSYLYIYCYVPHNVFDASKISISCDYSENGNIKNPFSYDLELVSTYGVFDKYLVKNFALSSESYRYYNLISIYRPFSFEFDKENTEGAITEEVSYSVGQQWCCYFFNNVINYEMNTFATVDINISTVGNVEYSGGVGFSTLSKGRSHYIAFNCDDYVITHIFDADMSYEICKAQENLTFGVSQGVEYSDKETKTITLKDTDTVSFKGSGLFAKTFNWKRIMKSTDFITFFESQNGKFNEVSKETLQNSQWVFAFCETEESSYASLATSWETWYEVSNVTILRLHFQDTTNKIYNLGVVSDSVSGDNITDGFAGALDFSSIEDMFAKIVLLIGILILIVILCFCTPIITGVLKILIYGIRIIITFPFKFIGHLFKKRNYKI